MTITATAGGTTSPSPGTYTYGEGTVVNVTATPNRGYTLDRWELDRSPYYFNTISVTMDSNHALHAIFVYRSKKLPVPARSCPY